MNMQLLLLMLLPTSAEKAIVKEAGGDVVTFTVGNETVIAMLCIGGALIAIGCGLLFLRRVLAPGFMRRRLTRTSFSIIFLGTAASLFPVLRGNDRVRVTPDNVEIEVRGEIVVFSLDAIRDQKMYQADDGRGGKQWYFKFLLSDGREYTYPESYRVVVDAFEYIRTLRFEKNLAADEEEAQRTKAEIASRIASRRIPHRPEWPGTPGRLARPELTPDLRRPFASSVAVDHTDAAQANVAQENARAPSALRPSAARQVTLRPTPHTRLAPTRVDRAPSVTAKQITHAMQVTAGAIVQAKWGGGYYAAKVLERASDGQMKIHYVGYNSAFDELVPLENLWIEPEELAKHTVISSSGRSIGGTSAGDSVADGAAESFGDMSAAALRTWTDRTGEHRVEARLVEVVDGKVTLLRADGKRVFLPVKRLSAFDQQYIDSYDSDAPDESE